MRARVLEAAAWWAVSYSIWLLSLSAVPLQELVVGAAASLPCALAATGMRWATGEAWTVRPRWLRPLLALPLALVSDTIQVLGAVITRKGGDFTTVATGVVSDAPAARSRRALATIFMSVSPGNYVLDADPETGDLMVHSLAKRGPRIESYL
ncbi:MAG TPA: Na+/H+ antiporter subunit E [Acidimicrobiales bacterium]|jgi:multisubunit Na+/H+ antiporter MnhE subunit